ncbi:MAG: nitroreductase family protein [Candidatus Lokiarchaeota archaeon]|nr:nitroreductase family protein [Candidatus Lokiarchaeota archaeon]
MTRLPGTRHAATWAEFSSVITGRRSYKQPFAPDAIPKEAIEQCIDLARWAPSAHNAQPWRFMTFYRQDARHQALRERLVDAMGAKYAADLARGGMAPGQVSRSCKARNQRFLDAPVLVLAFADRSALDSCGDEARDAAETTMGVQSVAAALQTLLLALHVAGLGACWYCAPLFAGRIVHDVLGVPATWQPQAFVAAGKATAGEPVERRADGRMSGGERRPVGEVAFDPGAFVSNRGGDSKG